MALDLFLLAVGLAILMAGGEFVVRGATGLARALGVSPLVIGLTVVAFGTSAPELAVNLIAAWEGRSGISFGNIMGSNMANVGVIVGATAIVRPLLITGVVIRREIPMMLLATTAAVVMGFDRELGAGPDVYNRSDGLLLLMFFLVFLYYTVGDFVRQRANHCARPGGDAHDPEHRRDVLRGSLATGVGLAALVGGADLTVGAGVRVAHALGVPEVVIGLTALAMGTSLPELVASVVATVRGHAELAIGNVVGSNIFNLLFVCGLTALVRPIELPPGGHLDLAMVSLLSLVLYFVSLSDNRRIVRTEAVFLVLSYLGYLGWRSGQAFG